jgi:hypothetical protein
MKMNYSALESARFGLRIVRGTATTLIPEEVLRTIVDEQVDVAILRIPTSEQYKLAQLSTLPFQVVAADTVVNFECDMRTSPPQPLRNQRLVVRRATAADQPIIEELVDLSFGSYRTHYHSNPLFAPEHILAGHREWVMSYVTPTPEKACFLFYLDERPVAFSAIALHEKHGEGVMIGARPGAASPGLYTDLVRHAMQYMLDHGRKWAHGTTQVQNHGVQRMWVREGFIPARSFSTIHINALLQHQAPSIAAEVAST